MALRIAGPKSAARAGGAIPPEILQALQQAQAGAQGGAPAPDAATPTDPDGDGDDDTNPATDTDNDQGQPQASDDSKKVDAQTAGYEGPDQGPFQCGNCKFYGEDGPGTCALVAGVIDQEGCCNLFTNANTGSNTDDESQEAPDDQVPPAEGAAT